MAVSEEPNAVFVKGLAKGATEKHLLFMFQQFGQILDCQIARHRSGRSAGFAIVTFSSHQEALRAMQAVDNSMFLGRKLMIRWFKPDQDTVPESFVPRACHQFAGRDGAVSLAELQGNVSSLQNSRNCPSAISDSKTQAVSALPMLTSEVSIEKQNSSHFWTGLVDGWLEEYLQINPDCAVSRSQPSGSSQCSSTSLSDSPPSLKDEEDASALQSEVMMTIALPHVSTASKLTLQPAQSMSPHEALSLLTAIDQASGPETPTTMVPPMLAPPPPPPARGTAFTPQPFLPMSTMAMLPPLYQQHPHMQHVPQMMAQAAQMQAAQQQYRSALTQMANAHNQMLVAASFLNPTGIPPPPPPAVLMSPQPFNMCNAYRVPVPMYAMKQKHYS